MIPFALLLLAALCNLAPEYVAAATGWSIAATEYVTYGVEAAALWWCAAWLLGSLAAHETWLRRWLRPSQLLCCYGMWEALQRPACRLVFPMDAPPKIKHPDGLCAAAGIPTYHLSPYVLLLIVLVFGHALYATTKD